MTGAQDGRIALIDYRAGNLTSVRKAFAALGAEVFTPEHADDLASASAIIVPGVGHFGATRALGPEWIEAILARVGEGRPLLGICLGMQWLFEGSEEAPELQGLGLLGGRCSRLRTGAERGAGAPAQPDRGEGPPEVINVKIPHVGWNSLDLRREGSIVEGVAEGAQVYFTHSFVAPVTGDTVAVTAHGEVFASIVQRGHVAGVQFHPEKSGEVGLQVLRNFLSMAG
jgi:imidazole glycerol-phosphate synthase subunit HisH